MLTLTDKNFDKYLSDEMPLFVMFKAAFAGPCKEAEETFSAVRGLKGNQFKFAAFDLDGNPAIPTRYGVRQIPLFVLFVKGEPVDLVAGAVPVERLLEMLDGA